MNKSGGMDALPNSTFIQDKNNFSQKEIAHSRLLSSNNISYSYGVHQEEVCFAFVIVSTLNVKHSLITFKGIVLFWKRQTNTIGGKTLYNQ